MYLRAIFQCKSVTQMIPQDDEDVRCQVVFEAVNTEENTSWSAKTPQGEIILIITDADHARQFYPGQNYALCLVSLCKKTTWRTFLDRICNLHKKEESARAWSRFIIWWTPAAPFVNFIWNASGSNTFF